VKIIETTADVDTRKRSSTKSFWYLYSF